MYIYIYIIYMCVWVCAVCSSAGAASGCGVSGAEPGSGPRPFEWGRRVCGGLSSALGVVRCGRSAGCVLCVLWAISAAVWGEYPVGLSRSSSLTRVQSGYGARFIQRCAAASI